MSAVTEPWSDTLMQSLPYHVSDYSFADMTANASWALGRQQLKAVSYETDFLPKEMLKYDLESNVTPM